MKILLLSAYDANSHQYWRAGLCQYFNDIQFTTLVLPARFFNWRIRGNGLIWSFAEREKLNKKYDLILATSMVDLATLRGLIPNLCRIPTILYFHENQFAYPISTQAEQAQQKGKADVIAAMMVQLYSALAADKILFNSHFNLQSFTLGLKQLLQQLPDFVPAGVTEALALKSQVLPVPLMETTLKPGERNDRTIVWNHRWEYDKGPEGLLHIIQALPANENFTFHIVGQSFRQVPAEFARIRSLLERNGWLGHWGFIEDKSQYSAILEKSHLVLSTSVHDFQGLSILEAVKAGCLPVVPDRLAYRDLLPCEFRYPEGSNREQEGQNAATLILQLCASDLPGPNLQSLGWTSLGPEYRQLFEGLAFEF